MTTTKTTMIDVRSFWRGLAARYKGYRLVNRLTRGMSISSFANGPVSPVSRARGRELDQLGRRAMAKARERQH